MRRGAAWPSFAEATTQSAIFQLHAELPIWDNLSRSEEVGATVERGSMSDGDRTRKSPTSAPQAAETADSVPRVFRSLKPGEIGPARMNPVHEERAQAAAQIQRTMKAWRAASGNAGAASIPKGSGAPLNAETRA